MILFLLAISGSLRLRRGIAAPLLPKDDPVTPAAPANRCRLHS
ncbi:MAG: hypothetical protein ERJ67_00195 [Aphanocapsa feldmannii 277cV]|uniref:Uncharacterized protein n=2 Tax=Aphanocapsa feldmannii TaxID=192050 RepID=A0A524RR71_9CHRO|nr:MAG: hypothetical protein ERJ67_00195 [Aphanocapsa feldmannii 277cV]TGH24456.1 MAG: hypothetical protein ERJ68_03250 [Aphanocapsa feldmannii 277cI]